MARIPPRSDDPLAAWSGNFLAGILPLPESLGLTPAQALDYQAAHERFTTSLVPLRDPAAATPVALTHKNEMKNLLLRLARQFLRIVDAHPGLLDTTRLSLRMNVRNPRPAPVNAPQTRPQLRVDPRGWVRIVDESAVRGHAKPARTAGALVCMRISELGAPAPEAEAITEFAVLATRWRIRLKLPPATNGKTLHVTARWYTARGDLGPVSRVVSTTIAA